MRRMLRCVSRVCAVGVALFAAAIPQQVMAQDGGAPLFELSIDVPDLILQGRPPTHELVIDVPPLIVVGRPDLYELVIEVPPLQFVGKPPLTDLVIDVPDLVVVGRIPTAELTIDVPDLTVVGRFDEPDERDDLGRAETQTVRTDVDVSAAQNDAPSTAAADDPEAGAKAKDWCHGNYTSHMGRGVGTAVGFAMPFGQNLTAPAQVEVLACGEALGVTVQGQTLSLGLIADTRRYSGSIDLGDGPLRTLILTCDADLNLRGQLVAADPNLRIERPVWMLRDAKGPADLTGCALPAAP